MTRCPQRHSRRIDVMQRFGFERDFGFAHDDVFGVSAIACISFAEDFVAFLELRHAGNRLPIRSRCWFLWQSTIGSLKFKLAQPHR